MSPRASTPEELAKMLKVEIAKWAAVIKSGRTEGQLSPRRESQ